MKGKWFFWLAISMVSLWLLAGCSSHPKNEMSWYAENGKVKVLSTIAMIDDLVSKIGKERIEHTVLIKGDIDPHSYELIKGDDEKIAMADVVFFNGLNLEHGASLSYKLQKHRFSVAVGDHVRSAHPERILMVDGQYDPHIWMDIATWQFVIDPIVESLCKADPDGAEYYKINAEKLREQMQAVHTEILSMMQNVPSEKRFLVTSHDAFGYFAKSYLATEEERSLDTWRKRVAAPEGLAPDGQLSASDIQAIIDHLTKHEIGVVFPESNVSQDSLKKIVSACKEKKREVRVSSALLYGDAMGSAESTASSYLDMIKHNADTLAREWQ